MSRTSPDLAMTPILCALTGPLDHSVDMAIVGVLHPGSMGSAVGAALRAQGHEVLWASEGRSVASAERARAAGMSDAGSVAALLVRSDVVLSICPPHAALEIAELAVGYDGVYVDANAVSPDTARAAQAAVGGRFVDGGIIGPPPSQPGTTRLYLSGDEAASVARLFGEGPLAAIALDGAVGAASALKMTYAAWTKGTAALLVAVRATARAHGVDDALLEEWALSQPHLADRYERALESSAEKGWRWVAEMREIAQTFAAAGQPDGFHLAAAEVFASAPAATRSSS
jgi:3-hydroxyisobutyrate dehydrogenase-like beta-hydroxyacid dehydrogenase